MKLDRRWIAVVVVCTVMALSSACSGDETDPSQPTAQPSVARPTPVDANPSPDPDETTPGSIEVRGVVGAVNDAANTLDIRATAGGDYSIIVVDPSTKIRRAGGGSAQLSQIRPSDRIVAIGTPGEDVQTLLATDITIQQLSPGGHQPGG